MDYFYEFLETIAPPMTMPDARVQVDQIFGVGNTNLPVHVSVLGYVLMVFLLPSILAPIQKHFEKSYSFFTKVILKPIMVVWNYALSLASFLMLLGVAVPWVSQVWTHYHFHLGDVVCDLDHVLFQSGPNVATTVTWYFMLSKFLELFDTLFLILKNPSRKVPFLHWYHHTTVLLFCWYAGFYECSTGPFFIVMNATIHTFMYYYYALAELNFKPKWGMLLTSGQIAQMLLGIAFTAIFAVRNSATGGKCSCQNADTILIACAIMYGSYLLLFVNFFVGKYFGKKEKKEKTA